MAFSENSAFSDMGLSPIADGIAEHQILCLENIGLKIKDVKRKMKLIPAVWYYNNEPNGSPII